MAKVVKLSVHKNTLAKRKRKDMKEAAIFLTKEIFNNHNVKAYALIAIDEEDFPHVISERGHLSPSQFTLILKHAVQLDVIPAHVDEEESEPGVE